MEFDINEALPDFGPVEDKSKNIIKVIGVGGGGCNAVKNMFKEGIVNVTFAVCNTDSQSLGKSPIPVKIQLGDNGLGAGANPKKGRESAEKSIEDIKHLLDDGTKMVFVTAGMGGGTGTGAAPVIAGIAKEKGILTVGIVTIPFSFEKKKKIIKALKGVEEMRKNVDALLIVNNERLCDIYSDTQVTIKEAFKRADQILSNATKSISELITIEGDINLDFCDVETTLRSGGGAIMAMGRAKGEHRVEKAIIDALDSPLLYGNDIDKAKRILFNIYTSEKAPLFVSEMQEIDAFMDELDPNIDVIWGVSDDNTIGEDAKVTILATGFEDEVITKRTDVEMNPEYEDDKYYDEVIKKLYHPKRYQETAEEDKTPEIPFTVSTGDAESETSKEVVFSINNKEEENHVESMAERINDETDVSQDGETEENRDGETAVCQDNKTEEMTPAPEDTEKEIRQQVVDPHHTEMPQEINSYPKMENAEETVQKEIHQTTANPEKIPSSPKRMTFVERVKAKMRQIAMEMTSDEDI